MEDVKKVEAVIKKIDKYHDDLPSISDLLKESNETLKALLESGQQQARENLALEDRVHLLLNEGALKDEKILEQAQEIEKQNTDLGDAFETISFLAGDLQLRGEHIGKLEDSNKAKDMEIIQLKAEIQLREEHEKFLCGFTFNKFQLDRQNDNAGTSGKGAGAGAMRRSNSNAS